jgi:hypothetical protein
MHITTKAMITNIATQPLGQTSKMILSTHSPAELATRLWHIDVELEDSNCAGTLSEHPAAVETTAT